MLSAANAKPIQYILTAAQLSESRLSDMPKNADMPFANTAMRAVTIKPSMSAQIFERCRTYLQLDSLFSPVNVLTRGCAASEMPS